MNKTQFVEALAARLDGDKKAAAAAVDGVVQTIYAALARGEKVALTGFGSFEKRVRNARTARNPATGAAVKVKKTSVPAFKAGAEFKAIASGAKKATPVKKATASKAPSTKATANKATANKATANKATANKATADGKTAAAKTLARNASAPARKTSAAKTLAKKASAKKAPAAKATGRSR